MKLFIDNGTIENPNPGSGMHLGRKWRNAMKGHMQTINESKLAALGEKFPWFMTWFLDQQRLCKKTKAIKEIRVERTDLKLCQRTTGHREVIALFDEEGAYIGTVGDNGKKKGMFWFIFEALFEFNFSRTQWDAFETVEMAIIRLAGGGSIPFYVVVYDNFYYNDLRQYAGNAIIYRPKGESLPEWLKLLRSGHAEELSKRLAEIS